MINAREVLEWTQTRDLRFGIREVLSGEVMFKLTSEGIAHVRSGGIVFR